MRILIFFKQLIMWRFQQDKHMIYWSNFDRTLDQGDKLMITSVNHSTGEIGVKAI